MINEVRQRPRRQAILKQLVRIKRALNVAAQDRQAAEKFSNACPDCGEPSAVRKSPVCE